MIGWRRQLSAVFVVLAVAALVRADTVSTSEPDAGCMQSARTCSGTDFCNTGYASLFDYPCVADLALGPVNFLPEFADDISQSPEVQRRQALTDGPSSLSLCLSALVGLGLCSSAHCTRRFSFGVIPEWYHNGGPFQIAHSHAVMPDSLSPEPVHCFIQPVWPVEYITLQYRLRVTVSEWRESQFAPAVITSRGPPSMS